MSAKKPTAKTLTTDGWLLNIVELARPLVPGDRVSEGGPLIYEVKRLGSKSTPIGGEERPLFAVLHGGSYSILVVVCLEGRQTSWKLPRTPGGTR